MNERAAPPSPEKPEAPQKPVQSAALISQVRGRDREFLPAALEILETPPAPIPVALMLTICAFFAAALAWSFVGRLDVHAVAPGKIETVSSAKVIQPFDNGKIAAIHVANGQHVKAGDLLLEMDPAEAAADADAARAERFESMAEITRRKYEVGVAEIARRARERARRETRLRARRDRRDDRQGGFASQLRPGGRRGHEVAPAQRARPPISTSSATRFPRSTSRSRRRRRRASAST